MKDAAKILDAAASRLDSEVKSKFLEPEKQRKKNKREYKEQIKTLQGEFDAVMENAKPRLEDDERSRVWNRMVLDYLMFKAEAAFAQALEKGLRKVGKKKWNAFRGPIINTVRKLANDAASPDGWLAKRLENPSVADADAIKAFIAEAFGLEPDAIPAGWTYMFDEIAKAMEEMTKGIRGYLPAGPEVAGLLTGPTEVEMEAEEESPSTAMDAAEALARAGERFRNRRAAEAIAQDTALPETGAEGEGDIAGLAGNTALSVGIREQYNPDGWGDLGRKVNVVGDGKPFYKRPVPEGKRKTKVKDIRPTVIRLAVENISHRENFVASKLPGDKDDRLFLRKDGILHQMSMKGLSHSFRSASDPTVDAIVRVGELFNASIAVPGDFDGGIHYRIAAMKLEEPHFVLFTEKDLGGKMDVRDVQIVKSVRAKPVEDIVDKNKKSTDASTQTVTSRRLSVDAPIVANLKEAWETLFLDGMEHHLKQKEAKPQPGLITIPPANTALSVGDLHTGARMAYGKPDSKFIGSGEGAQVFGWGHYSSNRKGVARDTYARRHVDYYKNSRYFKYKGEPKTEIDFLGHTINTIAKLQVVLGRIDDVVWDTAWNGGALPQNESGDFVIGDKTIPRDALLFVAADQLGILTGEDVFDAWKGMASRNFRGADYYDVAKSSAKVDPEAGKAMEFYSSILRNGPLKNAQTWASFVDKFLPKMEQLESDDPLPAVMTQTWWTHRPEGDESHLLDWYGPVSEENWARVLKTLEDLMAEHGVTERIMADSFGRGWRKREINGQNAYIMVTDFFRHMTESGYPEKDASEALYAHDIDGVKYPVDAFYNSANKDGRMGWNYVAFSDEHLRVDSVEEWNPETDRFEPKPVPGNVAFSLTYEELQAMPAVNADGKQPITSKAELKKAFKGFGVVANDDDGREALFPAASAGKFMSSTGERAEFILPLLGELYKTAKFVTSSPWKPHKRADGTMSKTHANYVRYNYYLNKVVRDGKEYYVRLDVTEQKNATNKIHSGTFSKVEVYEKNGDLVSALGQEPSGIKPPFHDPKIAEWLKVINEKGYAGTEPDVKPANTSLSMGGRPGRAPVVEPGGDVREAGEGALAWLRRKFVHSQTPVFDAVRRVMGVGREPPDALNVEAAAKNVHGKIRARQEMLQRAYLEPLKVILAQPGIDRKRFDDYALALHALERNRMIQERSVVVDPTTGEVVDLGVEAGSGVTNAWAERVIREIQRDPFAEQYKEAANILAEMNRFVLRGAVADGLLTEAQAKTWMRLSPHYVPLILGRLRAGYRRQDAPGEAWKFGGLEVWLWRPVLVVLLVLFVLPRV